ncbi:MAG: hypothetical protein LIP11_07985, partial [Clostridiales bacterium]|nr:hypothetical protein [Clostridiales bacterium]
EQQKTLNLSEKTLDYMRRYSGEVFDTSAFRNEENERLEKALLMAFDPFTNLETYQAIMREAFPEMPDNLDLSDRDQLHEYYRKPVMCLLRIKDSVDLMLEKNGSDGYFDFIEQYMGQQITGESMDFCTFFAG